MSIEGDYGALENSCGVVELPWSVFRITGPDRKKFLNGLVTSDVLKLAAGLGQSACLLTPKGMLRAHFLLYDDADGLLVLCPTSTSVNFAETMKKMIMLSESKIEEASARLSCLLLAGPKTPRVFAAAEALVLWPRLGAECRVAVVARARRAELVSELERAGVKPVGAEAFEVWRVERGLPLFGVDMNDATIPLEARLDDAISFDKGCYMGQETISRVHNLGHLNKILVQLKVTAAEPPAAGSAVLGADGKELGKVTSSVVSPKFGGILALATVRLDASKPGTVLGVDSGRGSHRAEVLAGAFQP